MVGFLDRFATRLSEGSELRAIGDQLDSSSADLSELERLTKQLAEEEEKSRQVLLELERERQQLITIFEGIDQPIFICHANDYTLLYYNDALETATKEPAVGKKCYTLLYGLDAPCENCPGKLEQCKRGSFSLDRYSDMSHRWYHIIYKCIEWPNDPVHPAIFGLMVDITERKAAEDKLQESMLMYKTLVDTSPVAITSTDLDGVITFASKRTVMLHGYDDAQELVGVSAFDLIIPEDSKRARDNMQHTLEGHAVHDISYTLLRKDGSSFRGTLNASLLKDATGKPTAFIAATWEVSN